MTIDQQIEGILFWKGEPMSLSALARALKVTESDIEAGIESLSKRMENSGITLIRKDDEIMLGTRRELSELLEQFQKEELDKELSKASLETLSVILYQNGATRSEIDYIRGVNSSFILRNLQIRGLIEKKIDPNDSRRYVYTPTFDAMNYLGVSSLDELPDVESVRAALRGVMPEEGNEGEN